MSRRLAATPVKTVSAGALLHWRITRTAFQRCSRLRCACAAPRVASAVFFYTTVERDDPLLGAQLSSVGDAVWRPAAPSYSIGGCTQRSEVVPVHTYTSPGESTPRLTTKPGCGGVRAHGCHRCHVQALFTTFRPHLARSRLPWS